MFAMGWTLWRHRHHYDILHVYQLTLLTLPAAFVCRLAGKALVVSIRCADAGSSSTIHNDKASLIAGPLDLTTPWLEVTGLTRTGGDIESLAHLGKPVVRLAHVLLLHTRSIVTLLSSRSKHDLVAHHFALPNVQLIPNGVDITRFYPRTVEDMPEERTRIVICVAQLRYQKGIDVLLQAWRLVQEKQGRVAPVRLLIVGSGSLRKQLERLADALGILDSVTFAGEQSDIPAQLRQSDIAVLPSRWEGMPNALLEAMACGLPCVATRVSGSEDIIQHGVNGLLIEPEDYEALAHALLLLLRDPVLAQSYGRNGRTTIEQHYALEHITDTYEELYHNLVEHPILRRGDPRGRPPASHGSQAGDREGRPYGMAESSYEKE
jgi:glycosyltransferase involved in cell wall biosynthesis